VLDRVVAGKLNKLDRVDVRLLCPVRVMQRSDGMADPVKEPHGGALPVFPTPQAGWTIPGGSASILGSRVGRDLKHASIFGRSMQQITRPSRGL